MHGLFPLKERKNVSLHCKTQEKHHTYNTIHIKNFNGTTHTFFITVIVDAALHYRTKVFVDAALHYRTKVSVKFRFCFTEIVGEMVLIFNSFDFNS